MHDIGRTLSMLSLIGLTACGTRIPDMASPGQTLLEYTLTEIDLVSHIKCELHLGTRRAIETWKAGGVAGGNGAEWLKNWQAKVNLKLAVDDTGSLNAGVSLIEPRPNAISYFRSGNVTSPQNFTASVGLQASAQAVRTETLAFTYRLGDLLKYDPLGENEDCQNVGKVPILGDLKIADFIVTKTGISAHPDTVPNDGKTSPFSVFSYQTTFVVTTGGSANLVWKLVNVAGNTVSPLANAVRKRSQDISITMGPVKSEEVAAVFQANVLAQSLRGLPQD